MLICCATGKYKCRALLTTVCIRCEKLATPSTTKLVRLWYRVVWSEIVEGSFPSFVTINRQDFEFRVDTVLVWSPHIGLPSKLFRPLIPHTLFQSLVVQQPALYPFILINKAVYSEPYQIRLSFYFNRKKHIMHLTRNFPSTAFLTLFIGITMNFLSLVLPATASQSRYQIVEDLSLSWIWRLRNWSV